MPIPPLYYLIRWVVSAAALMLTGYCVPGFKVKSFPSALAAAFAIGLANAFVLPIFMFFSYRMNLYTLALFTFLVNGMVLKLCATLLRGFTITNWFSAIFGAVFLTFVQYMLLYLPGMTP